MKSVSIYLIDVLHLTVACVRVCVGAWRDVKRTFYYPLIKNYTLNTIVINYRKNVTHCNYPPTPPPPFPKINDIRRRKN